MAVVITGNNTPTAGGVTYGDGTTYANTAAGTAGQVLTSAGVSAPAWANPASVNLATGVTGTLPIANGGTNSTATATAGGAGYGTGTAHAYTAAGTAGQLLQSNGASAPTWATVSAGFTLGTAVATTSGTSFTFTGIPSSAKVIFLSLANVSFTAGVNLLVTLGDAGGLETSGYLTHGGQIYDNSLAATIESAAAIRLARTAVTAGASYSGVLTLILLDSSTNTWSYSGSFGLSSMESGTFVGGTKSLTQVLDRISISGGTFDDGKANIAYI